jgi:MFS family permease
MTIQISHKQYTTGIICFTVAFLFADQNLLAPNLSIIADEFHFTDAQRDDLLGGKIAIGFFIVGGFISILAGYLTDVSNRIPLFSFIVFFGESACMLTYWTTTYWQLFICRVLTGISIGGATPIIFSIFGDLYSENERANVSTFVGLSMSLGVCKYYFIYYFIIFIHIIFIALGQMLAGFLGSSHGWRLPFLIIAIPSLFLALLILMTVKEPVRGSQEREVRLLRRSVTSRQETISLEQPTCGDVERDTRRRPSVDGPLLHPIDTLGDNGVYSREVIYSERIDCTKVGILLRTPSALLVFLQGIPGCLPWGMVYTFLNDYFSNDRGMSVAAATLALTTFGIGGFAGMISGGLLGQWLYNRKKSWQCFLMGSTTMISVLPMLYLLNSATPGGVDFYIVSIVAGFIVNMNGPNVRAVLQVR